MKLPYMECDIYELRELLAKEIVKEMKDENGIELSLSVVREVIASEGVAIKHAMTTKVKKIKCPNFGSFVIKPYAEERYNIKSDLFDKGIRGKELIKLTSIELKKRIKDGTAKA